MGRNARGRNPEPGSLEPWDVVVDPSLDWQDLGGGLLVFWWTNDDGTREGMLCAIELCQFPACPLRDATIHAVRVGPGLARIWCDEHGEIHAETKDGPFAPHEEERFAAIRVIFERKERRVGPAKGDAELVRRLYEVLDEKRMAVIEGYWERTRLSDPARQHLAEPGRNAPCPCGSGKKYKKCCMNGAIKAQRLPNGTVALSMRLPVEDDRAPGSAN